MSGCSSRVRRTIRITCSTAGRAAPGEQVKLPDNDTVWTASADTLSTGHPVTLSWDNGAGLTFQIALSVDDDYMFSRAAVGEERHQRSR